MREAVAVLGIGLAWAASGCGPQVDVAAETAAIERGREEWRAAYRAGDVDRLEMLYTDDAVLMPPDQPAVSGKAAVDTWHDKFFQQFTLDEVSLPADEIVLAGQWAYVRGHGRMTARGRNQQPLTVSGKFIEIWKRQEGGGWKWARMIWNLDAPLRPQPPAAAKAAAKAASAKAPTMRFAVQLGAFEERASANALASRINAAYKRSTQVMPVRVEGKTLYRVRIAMETEAQATALAARIRREQKIRAIVVPLT